MVPRDRRQELSVAMRKESGRTRTVGTVILTTTTLSEWHSAVRPETVNNEAPKTIIDMMKVEYME
jgi:hypothetical protein